MHAKYQRHIQHARGDVVLNRQLDTPDGGGTADGYGGGFTLTAPLTITIRTTLEPPATPTSYSSVEEVATSLPTSASVETSSSQSVSLSTTSSSPTSSSSTSSSSSYTLFPSVIQPSSIPSIVSSGHDTTPESSSALSTTSLPPGGIAGIVIGCLILLLLGLFFGLRQRCQRNRLRLRGMWTRNKTIGLPTLIPYESDMAFTEKGASQVTGPTSPAPQFSPAIARKISVRVPPPPISYNNNEGTTTPHTGLLISTSPAIISNQSPDSDNGGGNTGPLDAPVYSPGPAALSPFAAVVVCTFITNLPDELSIKVGETIRVLAEYDDGWALCMNMNGQQGMIPMECLNGGGTAMNLSAPRLPDGKGIRRSSSLDPPQALTVRRNFI